MTFKCDLYQFAVILTKDIVQGSTSMEDMCSYGFDVTLEHGTPHYDLVRDIRNLSEEFAYTLASKNRFGSNECGGSMAENIVFHSVGLKSIIGRIIPLSDLTEHPIHVEDNV